MKLGAQPPDPRGGFAERMKLRVPHRLPGRLRRKNVAGGCAPSPRWGSPKPRSGDGVWRRERPQQHSCGEAAPSPSANGTADRLLHFLSHGSPGHISTGRDNLVIVKESAAREISRVSREFSGYPDVSFPCFQGINTANVVQTPAGHVATGRGISTCHYPGTTQGDCVHLKQ